MSKCVVGLSNFDVNFDGWFLFVCYLAVFFSVLAFLRLQCVLGNADFMLGLHLLAQRDSGIGSFCL